MKITTIMAAVLLLLASGVPRADAQESVIVKKGVAELMEALGRQAGESAARELTEMGGETAVRELLEKATQEGGEQLVEKVVQYGSRFGPAALKAVGRSPAQLVKALDELAPELVQPAIRAAAREPQAIASLVSQFGREGLEIAAQHPGVGVRLAEQLGADGVKIGRTLSTDQAIQLSRHAGDIGQLAAAPRSQILAKIAKSPAAVLDFLEKHPKILLTAGGVAVVLAVKDDMLGTPGQNTPGFVERAGGKVAQTFNTPLQIVLLVLAAGVAGWVTIQLWGAWKARSIRLRLAAAEAEIKAGRMASTPTSDNHRSA